MHHKTTKKSPDMDFWLRPDSKAEILSFKMIHNSTQLDISNPPKKEESSHMESYLLGKMHFKVGIYSSASMQAHQSMQISVV